MIRMRCPACKVAMTAQDERAGKTAACPKCKQRLVVPTPNQGEWGVYKPKSSGAALEPAASHAPPVRVPTEAPNPRPDKQRCPFCDEEVSVNAKKCKHCGETLDHALREAREAKELALRRESVVNVNNNNNNNLGYERRVYYRPPPASNGLAVASFVLGLLALVLFCIPFLSFPLAALILVMGGVALAGVGSRRGMGLAVAGLALSLISFLPSLMMLGAMVGSHHR